MLQNHQAKIKFYETILTVNERLVLSVMDVRTDVKCRTAFLKFKLISNKLSTEKKLSINIFIQVKPERLHYLIIKKALMRSKIFKKSK